MKKTNDEVKKMFYELLENMEVTTSNKVITMDDVIAEVERITTCERAYIFEEEAAHGFAAGVLWAIKQFGHKL